MLLFQLLARLDPEVAFRGWQLGSAALYGVVGAWLLRAFSASRRWWLGLVLLVWAPFWSTLDLGQVYALLLALAAVAFVTIERRPFLAGVCIGLLVAVKPQYAVWPVLLLAAWHWRPGSVALATGAVASALPVLFGHLDWYPRWVEALSSTHMLVYSDNLSLPSLLSRAGASPRVAGAATLAGLAVLFAAVVVRRWQAQRVSGVALVAATLAGPVSWVGYAVLLAPVFASVGARSERMTIAALLLCVPGVLLWWSEVGFLIYDVALGLCLWALLVERPERLPTRQPMAREMVPERYF